MFLFHSSPGAPDGDGRSVPALQSHFNVFELVCAVQQFLQPLKVRRGFEDFTVEISFEKFVQLLVCQHLL